MTDERTAERAVKLSRERAKRAVAKYQTDSLPDSDFILSCLNANEAGDAELAVLRLKNRFAFDRKQNAWFTYACSRWQKDILNTVTTEARKQIILCYDAESRRQAALANDPRLDEEQRKKAANIRDMINRRINAVNTAAKISNILAIASSGDNSLAVSGDQWDPDPYLLQAENTVINLKTGMTQDPSPDLFITAAAPALFKGLDEPAPEFQKFLQSIFEDPEKAEYVQKIFGAAMIAKVIYHELYLFLGVDGRNGKSTLVNAISETLGDALTRAISVEMLLDTKPKPGPNPELLDLKGKRILFASETAEGKRINSEGVKRLTGGDILSARPNYGNDIIQFRPTHSIFLQTNFLPRIPANDVALWERIKIINFPFRFVDSPKKENERPIDRSLADKLKAEKNGILTWLVQGCLKVQRDGLRPPLSVLAEINAQWTESDIIGQFAEECVYESPGAKTLLRDIYGAFSEWCEENTGQKPRMNSQQFNRDFKRRYAAIPGKKPVAYADIKIYGA